MPWIERRSGNITGLFGSPNSQRVNDGFLPDDDPEVVAFRQQDRRPARDPRLNDTPANVNSVPALRAEVNALKALLRGE